ncbi:MAG TPA: hypothetical protein VMV47_14885 [Bacteroidales bacterium]|nr:hypothetical protein [Bacteroidales bacterium]
MSTDIRHIWCGGHIQKPAVRVQAGTLSMLYENGSIRYISAGKNEIIRMVYSAVRDREWLSVKPVITSEWIERSSDSFRIEYKCNYITSEIEFAASYIIEGKPDNTITFILEGEAKSTFEKNRIGFCVLHPVEGLADKSCIITHTDGSIEPSSFPAYINPQQLFTDIRSMKWTRGELDCFIEFSGDIFETEDQRNWTDASFKTYSTPQSLPAPVKVNKGDLISQKVIFRAENPVRNFTQENGIINISLTTESSVPLPKIGVGRSTRNIPLEEDEIVVLRNIKFDHYRCNLYLFNPDWEQTADKSMEEALKLGYLLELALFFDDEYRNQSESFVRWIDKSGAVPGIILIFHKKNQVTPPYLEEYLVPVLRKAIPEVLISTGTNANFEQLNSDRPKDGDSDLICYSVHPQEHASDNITLIENLRAQAYTVESLRQFSGKRGIWVSPVNIQRRFNANIENYESHSADDSIPYQVDSRMMSLFGACWTAGSLKYIGESGVSGITYYETAGERGIFQGNIKTPWPDSFRSSPGKIFPAFHIFRWLLEDKSYNIISSSSSKPLNADVLALLNGSELKITIFNTGSENLTIRINGSYSGLTRICLETDIFEDSGTDPSWIKNGTWSAVAADNTLTLSPYSITFLQGTIQNH